MSTESRFCNSGRIVLLLCFLLIICLKEFCFTHIGADNAVANFGHIMFFNFFADTGKTRMEPLFLLIALGSRLAGNLSVHRNWAT